ncbi:hypothetical protein [Roseicyclus marinus]|uniref:hypothetical protein n=1 Tax=Roseicyclus marinus TaxID=2161673 RepID=UPI00240FEA02|nr:hypothetical protein [Roseicyclus marinus]MDG3040181.1 hypothetical protein [Roseicyclus marinus]
MTLRKANRLAALTLVAAGLGGCAAFMPVEDACEMANREASFPVLMQNSMLNVYNMCLEHMRQEIVTEWGEQ